MKILNLKKNQKYISQYVEIRNEYHKLLLTNNVTYNETIEWLKNTTSLVFIAVENAICSGAAIISIDKNGEVSIFVHDKNKGIGKRLIKHLETEAKKIKLPYLWAWTLKDNTSAENFFLKTGFSANGESIRKYDGVQKNGLLFKKTL